HGAQIQKTAGYLCSQIYALIDSRSQQAVSERIIISVKPRFFLIDVLPGAFVVIATNALAIVTLEVQQHNLKKRVDFGCGPIGEFRRLGAVTQEASTPVF
ncbi:MAG: hypothetical protein WCK93_13135, partial [Nitrosomonadales bacterium]